jgi:hypothetical protein
VFRVRAGPFDRKEDAEALKEKLDGSGIETSLVAYRNRRRRFRPPVQITHGVVATPSRVSQESSSMKRRQFCNTAVAAAAICWWPMLGSSALAQGAPVEGKQYTKLANRGAGDGAGRQVRGDTSSSRTLPALQCAGAFAAGL